jgi:hypothetical protein
MDDLFQAIVSRLLADIRNGNLRMAELLDEVQSTLDLSPADGSAESQQFIDLAQEHFDDYEAQKREQRRRMDRLQRWLQFWNFGIDCRRS